MTEEFRPSASVPLDDIDTIKRRQTENWDALQINNAAITRTNVRVDALDRGQVEILKQIADNTAVTKQIGLDTQGLVEIAKALGGVFKLIEILGKWAKPSIAIVLLITALIGCWKAFLS